MKEINQEKITTFIDQHKEALQLLKQKIDAIDTVRGVTTVKEMMARKHAITIIDGWLHEIWGIKTADIPDLIDEDDELFRVVKQD